MANQDGKKGQAMTQPMSEGELDRATVGQLIDEERRLQAESDRLEKQRDELVAALDRLINADLDYYSVHPSQSSHILRRADALDAAASLLERLAPSPKPATAADAETGEE